MLIFTKKISFQKITPQGIEEIGKAVEVLAAAEQLEAHKNAMTLRLNYLKSKNQSILSEKLKSN